MSVTDISTVLKPLSYDLPFPLKMVSVTAFYINRDLKKTTCLHNSWQKALSYIFKASKRNNVRGHRNTESMETQLLTELF